MAQVDKDGWVKPDMNELKRNESTMVTDGGMDDS